MNQYEKENALEKIRGYFFRPLDKKVTKEESFEKAKAEAVGHLQRQLDHVKSLTVEDFFVKRS